MLGMRLFSPNTLSSPMKVLCCHSASTGVHITIITYPRTFVVHELVGRGK